MNFKANMLIKQLIAMTILGFTITGAPAATGELVTLKSSHDGVTVTVTPTNFGAGAKFWDFKVVLDTHSQDLSDDLTTSAVLVDNTGRQSKPLGWEGAPPGGHHREGVLRFPAFDPLPESIELRLLRPGELSPRVLRWQRK